MRACPHDGLLHAPFHCLALADHGLTARRNQVRTQIPRGSPAVDERRVRRHELERPRVHPRERRDCAAREVLHRDPRAGAEGAVSGPVVLALPMDLMTEEAGLTPDAAVCAEPLSVPASTRPEPALVERCGVGRGLTGLTAGLHVKNDTRPVPTSCIAETTLSDRPRRNTSLTMAAVKRCSTL